jgi:hypothetical protein
MSKDLCYFHFFNKITEFFRDLSKYSENGSMSVTYNKSKNNKLTNHWFSIVPTACFMAKFLFHS